MVAEYLIQSYLRLTPLLPEMFPYPGRVQPEKVYHTAEGAAMAALAATCVLPPPIAPMPPQIFNMNPTSYENVDNVDWAALAQQWIHMNKVNL